MSTPDTPLIPSENNLLLNGNNSSLFQSSQESELGLPRLSPSRFSFSSFWTFWKKTILLSIFLFFYYFLILSTWNSVTNVNELTLPKCQGASDCLDFDVNKAFEMTREISKKPHMYNSLENLRVKQVGNFILFIGFIIVLIRTFSIYLIRSLLFNN
jgi:hypothetical protein